MRKMDTVRKEGEMTVTRWVARRKSDGVYSRVVERNEDEEGGIAEANNKNVADATFYRKKRDAVSVDNDRWEAVPVLLTITSGKGATP